MTIKEAATLYGISPQAVYQRLKAKGYDVKQLKTKSGDLTPEGESLMEDLFDRASVTGEGEVEAKKDQGKTEDSLYIEVEKLKIEVESLKKQVENLKEERDYLRKALDQSQQLQAMSMRMLPPAPVERRGVFSRMFDRFKKQPAAPVDQPEEKVE